MLQSQQYFVPVIRFQDQSIYPSIGQPFSPSKPLKLSEDDIRIPDMKIQRIAGPIPLNSIGFFRKKGKLHPEILILQYLLY